MKLLPCPFCGGEAEIERYGNRIQSTQYRCTGCGCFLETGEERDHGERWNKRYSAKESVMERGKEISKDYNGTPREKVILDMAAYTYEYIEGKYEPGRATFDELSNPEKEVYIQAARWAYKLAMWSKGIDPNG